MDQQYPRSPWYDQSLPAAAAAGGKKKPRKKRTGLKITAISLCVLILIVASAVAFSDGTIFDFSYDRAPAGNASENAPSGNSGNSGSTKPAPDVDEDGYFRNFNDFFAEYYTSYSATSTPNSNLQQGELHTDFRLELVSAEGKERLTLQELYTACADSVVGIRTIAGSGMNSSMHWGSGFVVSEDGLIITNQHVISEAEYATVVLADGREYEAGLVGEDAQTDVALLKIAARDLKPLEIGDSSELMVGDDVVAIGNPLGEKLTGTMTNGIISAIDRSISYNGHYMTMLQTNTALNEGNSGGPLLNMYGQVVGITNMKMSAVYSDVSIEGIGFSIPSATVKAVTDQLIEKGKYVRPGLGITVGEIPEDAGEHYQLPEGLYISAVSEGSSAKEQGVQPGDILTHVNGTPVRKTNDVLEIRDSMEVGDEMTLTLFRDGETFDVVIVLRELATLY